jgi:anti-sigma B factor antagonist
MTQDQPFATRPVELGGRRVCCVEVVGDLDLGSAPGLKAHLLGLIDEGASWLVVELIGATSIDSSGLAALVAVHRRLTRGGGALALVIADDHIADRFERAGIDRLLTLAPSREAALDLLEDA